MKKFEKEYEAVKEKYAKDNSINMGWELIKNHYHEE
jgi:hypothetical protein